jgi:TPR repeat protein|mmetsp:Transcript_11615/g.21080  ORF Transcript_11615/g.21080 Transcript_11615/m.21080 type:complete len:92 (-) Transcript_11615:1802-2077(-)
MLGHNILSASPAQRGHYYKLVANQGHTSVQNNLGLLYKKGNGDEQDYDKAGHYLQLAAEQGYAKAKRELDSMDTRRTVSEAVREETELLIK